VSLAEELLKNYEHLIESLVLIPSDGGKFEVTANGNVLYSKAQTRRHAEAGEILGLLRKLVGE
jgi:selenoprotein W-related protein